MCTGQPGEWAPLLTGEEGKQLTAHVRRQGQEWSRAVWSVGVLEAGACPQFLHSIKEVRQKLGVHPTRPDSQDLAGLLEEMGAGDLGQLPLSSLTPGWAPCPLSGRQAWMNPLGYTECTLSSGQRFLYRK